MENGKWKMIISVDLISLFNEFSRSDFQFLLFIFRFPFSILFCECAFEDLRKMQATVSGKQRILPEMSCALYVESGIVGKCRLFVADDGFSFAVSAFFWLFFFMGFLVG